MSGLVLVVEEGENRGERFTLPAGESWAGRAPECALVLPSEGVSRRHARLVMQGEALTVEDQESRNGTWVNGVRVAGATLRPGDRLRLGDVTLRVRARGAEHGSTLELSTRGAELGPGARDAPEPDTASPALSPEVELWGEHPSLRRLLEQVERVARAGSPVLVRGETGTGKELVARAVHALSPRRRAPFVAVNCALLEGPLLESELFGHERGAFTGAAARKQGLVEVAGEGVLFLDEVGELPAGSQAKLLRLLEQGEFRRVGGTEPLHARCQVICATHQDLDAQVAGGRFRADLLWRLRVVELLVPPLRERGGDLDLLADRLLARLLQQAGRRLVLGAAARTALRAHSWPGNVRELKNALERAVILAPGPELRPEDLPLGATRTAAPPEPPSTAGGQAPFPTLAELERQHLLRALERTGGARAEAAALLGIDRKTLYRRLKALGLSDDEDEPCQES